jgi:hypothetical protein
MPRELVEEEEQAAAVVQMAEPDLVPGPAVASALVRVVLLAVGRPMLVVVVGVRAKGLAPMGLADKEPERAVVKEVVRVA